MTAPRWLAHRLTDLTAPAIAAEVQVRAAWVALGPSGEPVRHGYKGFLTHTVVLFTGRESAAQHGAPVLVDVFAGEPVRVHLPDPVQKLCECGCGASAPITKKTVRKYGHVAGQPVRFVSGHNGRKPRVASRYVHKHRRDPLSGSEFEHVQVAARALGKRIPRGSVVHHVDGDRSNNRGQNLVICQDRAYHNLLHVRLRALRACGNPDWRRCHICKRWDAPEKLRIPGPGKTVCHPECNRESSRRWREKRATQGLHAPTMRSPSPSRPARRDAECARP